MNEPRLSFVCPSYNHERFVVAFLDSVLAQTCSDWELIIVDDGSQDETVKRIMQYKDPRIRLFVNPRNMGINAGINRGVSESSAPIITFIASDDILYPDYIQTVLAEVDKGADVVCSALQPMDESGHDISGIYMSEGKDLPEDQVCRQMFLKDNFVQSPGLAVRREIVDKMCPLPLAMLPMQDVLMNLVAAYFGKIVFLERPIVRYRLCASSASHGTDQQIFGTQIFAETQIMMTRFAEIVAAEPARFNRNFSAYSNKWRNAPTARDIPFWLGVIATESLLPARRLWGLQTILRFWSEGDNSEFLYHRQSIKFADMRNIIKAAAPIPYFDDRALGIRRHELVPGFSVVCSPRDTKVNVFGLCIRLKKRG